MVNTDHKYWMSRKKTNNAESIKPTPTLNSTRQVMGYSSRTNFHVNVMWSKMQNKKNTHRVRPKLMRVCTFLENRNRYLGIFTLVNMEALPMRDIMPWLVDSLKQEKIILPQKRYVVKCGVVRPKNWVNTSFITNRVSNGDSTLHTIPNTVRLYFCLKSRLTNSSKRKR